MTQSQRILVVDDEVQIARVLRRSLAARGYEVQVAGEGEEALEIFNAWAPDLVITDLSMPNMGGLELCRRIRANSQAPIIVLSVKGEERAKVEALDAGADAALASDRGSTGQGHKGRRFPCRPRIAQRQGARLRSAFDAKGI